MATNSNTSKCRCKPGDHAIVIYSQDPADIGRVVLVEYRARKAEYYLSHNTTDGPTWWVRSETTKSRDRPAPMKGEHHA